MIMDVNAQKRLAAKVMKIGLSRVRITDEKSVSEALTRNDIRRLIVQGAITKVEKRGSSKKYSSHRLAQKKKGRGVGKGSWKGKRFAKKSSKDHWIDKVRPLRRLLRDLRDNSQIGGNDYRKLYLMVKGGAFRNKNHLLYYLKGKEMLKAKDKTVRASKEKGAKNERKS
jgi:large subunit ribosomal protein L19e